MKTPLQILGEIQIASPCLAAWDEMHGDDFARHCDQCDKNVYDLSQLTAQAAVDLMREKEGKLCIQLYKRRDGTVLTADCPVGVRAGLRRVWRRTAAFAASLATFFFLSGCATSVDSDAKVGEQTVRPTQKEKDECVRLGGVLLLPNPAPAPAKGNPQS